MKHSLHSLAERAGLLKLYLENKERFDTAPGSKRKHQAWRGGYADHLSDVVEIGTRMHRTLSPPIDLEDFVLVTFLHDLDKVFTYTEPCLIIQDKFEFILDTAAAYGVSLTYPQMNALRYAHGEGGAHNPEYRIINELGAFLHAADILSARVFHSDLLR